MSSNISKWFPKVSLQQTNDKVFGKTRSIERELRMLANKFTTNINFNLLDYYVSNTFHSRPLNLHNCLLFSKNLPQIADKENFTKGLDLLNFFTNTFLLLLYDYET